MSEGLKFSCCWAFLFVYFYWTFTHPDGAVATHQMYTSRVHHYSEVQTSPHLPRFLLGSEMQNLASIFDPTCLWFAIFETEQDAWNPKWYSYFWLPHFLPKVGEVGQCPSEIAGSVFCSLPQKPTKNLQNH